jgi:hypothetical protein
MRGSKPVKRKFDLPVNAVETWSVIVDQETTGEYIAYSSSTDVIGEGATQDDALEDFQHKAFVAPQLEAKRLHNKKVDAFGRFMAKLRLTPKYIKRAEGGR